MDTAKSYSKEEIQERIIASQKRRLEKLQNSKDWQLKKKFDELMSMVADQKKLKFRYFSVDMGDKYPHPATITAASIVNADETKVSVAFAFCDPRDVYHKIEGKYYALQRLLSEAHKFKVEIPWTGDGILSTVLAYSELPSVPGRFQYVKFDINVNLTKIR